MYHKWQIYDVWFLRYGAWPTEFFCHFGPFFTFYPPPPKNLKNQNFEKINKAPRDIIIYTIVPKIMIICITVLHRCTKNRDLMVYCSWDMASGGYNCYFSFWAICSKNENLPKIMVICYTVPEIWHATDLIVLILFFARFLPTPP